MKKISRNVSLNQRLAGISFAVFIPMILVMTYLLASLTNATSAYAQITKSVSYGNCSFVHRNVCSRYGNIC